MYDEAGIRQPSRAIPLEYLSNALPGRPASDLVAFQKADLESRRRMARGREARLRRLTIWQLHEVATLAAQTPKVALPHAQLGLEMARAVSGDDDLLSWGHSELGNVLRLLNDPKAKAHLDEGVSLARNPYEKANALQKRGVLGLRPFHKRSAEIALPFMEQAMEVSPTGEALINSDRGHPAVLASTGLVNYYLGNLDIAKNLYCETLDIACPRHAKRFRCAALVTLASISINFGQATDLAILEKFRDLAKSPDIAQKSLQGAMIQWNLIYDEIRRDGYDWNKRRRLLTVRNHLTEHSAWDRAASLTLCIAGLDAVHGMRALHFLQKRESLEVLSKGLSEGAALVARIRHMVEANSVTNQFIVRLAERFGGGAPGSISDQELSQLVCIPSPGCNIRGRGIPLEYLSNSLGGRRSAIVAAFHAADLEGRRKIAGRDRANRRLTIWQLHEVATLAAQAPRIALPHAELALEMAQAISGDDDLLSWGHSELGNVLRLLNDPRAEAHLDEGVSLARNPWEKANALQKRGVLGLRPFHKRSAEAALPYMELAMEVSPTGEARIDSDRGHPAVLASTALVHYYLGHIDIAKDLYYETLDIACPRHAKRFRRAALVTLASIFTNFDRVPDSEILKRFRALATSRAVSKRSLQGALIQWVFIYDEIRNDGYDGNKRHRLLTVREHLLGHEAWDRAAFLTLCIAALDATYGMKALLFLKRPKSLELLAKGMRNGKTLAAELSRMDDLGGPTAEIIVRLAEQSGAGNARTLASMR